MTASGSTDRRQQAATIALTASLLVHAAAAVWLLTQTVAEPLERSASSLTVLLQPAEAKPSPQPSRSQPPEPVAPANRVAPERANTTPGTQAVVAASRLPQEPEPAEVAPADAAGTGGRSRLNLSRPADWDALATETPEALASSAFKKSDREAVSRRQQERARSRALTQAQVARVGLPEEAYRRRTGAGEEVKTAKGCFVKRPDNALNGYSERWWRTACRDSKVAAWKREVLSFGPDHRVLVEPRVPDAQP